MHCLAHWDPLHIGTLAFQVLFPMHHGCTEGQSQGTAASPLQWLLISSGRAVNPSSIKLILRSGRDGHHACCRWQGRHGTS